MKMPSSSEIQKRYTNAIPSVSAAYQEAVRNTTGVIAAAKSDNAENLYAAKVQEAIANKSRQKGLEGVSDSDWQNAAATKGAQRIGPGMTASASKQASNFEPYRSTLASLELAPRTSDPMTNVQQRVGAIAVALSNQKKQQ